MAWAQKAVLWVLVTAEVQCQANTRYWPGGRIKVQHPKLLAPLHAPAPACPHEARSGNSQVINRCSVTGAFYVG